MSDKAREHIRKAIQLYLEEDGATERGAVRDAITDALHIADDVDVNRMCNDRLKDKDMLAQEAYDCYEEEERDEEIGRIDKIPDSDLPLHLDDYFEFEDSKSYLEERIKKCRHAAS